VSFIRVEEWKLIKGCAGTYTDWYNLNNFTHEYSRAKGHELSISTKTQNCLNPENLKNSTFSYFLFNIKSKPLIILLLAKFIYKSLLIH
jgi:hypothetical protein